MRVILNVLIGYVHRQNMKPAALASRSDGAQRLERVRERMGYQSLRSFWKHLEKGWNKADGRVSYEAVRYYHSLREGQSREAPVSYLVRIAQVFPQVRLDYLTTGDGPMTRAEAEIEHELEADPQPSSEGLQVVFKEFEKVVSASEPRLAEDPLVRRVVVRTWRRMLRARLIPRMKEKSQETEAPLSGIGAILLGYLQPSEQPDPEDQRDVQAVGRYLGRALGHAFCSLPLRPAALSDDAFHDYVTLTCQALGRLADAHRDRAPWSQPLPEPGPIPATIIEQKENDDA